MSIHDLSMLYKKFVLHGVQKNVPKGFEFVHHLADTRNINLQIGLRGRDIDGLVKRLYEISTPGSPSFRKYLSKEEAEAYVRPTPETLDKVHKWLGHYGLQSESISPSGNRLKVTVSVKTANRMLNTAFSAFRYTKTETDSVQALSYSLPSEVEDMIESIEPTTSFPIPPSRPGVPTETNDRLYSDVPKDVRNRIIHQYAITPERLRQRYGIPADRAIQENTLAVPAWGFNYANRKHLELFLSAYRPDLNGATFTEQSIDGGENIQEEDTPYQEGNVDVQYTVGLVNFSPVVFVSSGSYDVNGFINVFNTFLKEDNPPTVVSVSYGFNELSQIDSKTMTTLSVIFAHLGVRGVSVLVSTGDGGVAGTQSPSTGSDAPTKFIPTFPASCPFVTAVGATTLMEGDPDKATEIGASLSAGGFSNYFPREPYQDKAVKDYLDQIGSQHSILFNRDGQAFPDISAIGQNVAVIMNGVKIITAGTSLSTPIVASIIALLNDRLHQKGESSLGFLNPWLYANPEVCTDITAGCNSGCGTNGFSAKPGWDPVTGLGSPNFAKMAKALGVE